MPIAATFGLALIALIIGAGIGHLATRRHRREADRAAARLAAFEAALSKLRHDIRGALSPAMLSADRLSMSGDPAVARSGEMVVEAIERVSALLDANRKEQGSPIAPAGSPDLNSRQG